MSFLILVRHGQSLWNLEKKFTGWVDVDLTDNGKFYFSLDSGENWTMTSSFTGPGAHYFYGSTIWPSRLDTETVYIGGSGYSNSPVYVSYNHVQTFEEINQSNNEDDGSY